jgi:acetylornithine deacetylase/succinyl-diaminopimelate desuccinylase-like protein
MTGMHTGAAGLSLYGSAAHGARAYLAAQQHHVLDIVRRLVEAPSPNPPGDETAPAAIVRIEASRPGPALALCGHLDTKPVGDAGPGWKTDPLRTAVDEDRLIGLGACDMKGAVSAMIMAGAAFRQVSHLAAGSLALVFTAGEENGTRAGVQHLAAERVLDVDALALGEPSCVHRDWEALRTVSQGICGFVITVRGQQIHSSLPGELGQAGAVERLSLVLAELRRTLRVRNAEHALCPAGPTVSLGVRLAGGVGFGVLPGEAELWGDIRTSPGMTREAFEEDMHHALDPIRTSCSDVSIEFPGRFPWMAGAVGDRCGPPGCHRLPARGSRGAGRTASSPGVSGRLGRLGVPGNRGHPRHRRLRSRASPARPPGQRVGQHSQSCRGRPSLRAGSPCLWGGERDGIAFIPRHEGRCVM